MTKSQFQASYRFDLHNSKSNQRGFIQNMSDVKHSTVLNDLASFYVSKADFDFTPPTSPNKTTPPTSDSEGDPPPQAPVVDDAAAQELRNMFQNKSSTTRRSKGTARHKQSTVAAAIGGGPVGETTRKSKRTGPISSTKTSLEQNSTRSSGRGRVSGDENLGKEANLPSALQRLKERSLSKSNRNDSGGGDSALEILKARSISRSRSKVVTSSQTHERASRTLDHQGDTTAETLATSKDHHEISSSISSPKSQRSRKLAGRSKSGDLELLESTQNERRLVSRVAEQEVPLKGDDGDDSMKKKTRSLSRERRRGIGRSKSDDLTQLSAHGRSQSQTRGHSRDGGRRRRRSADADDGKMIEAAMQMVDPSLMDPDVDAEVTRIISGRKAVEEASPPNGDMDVSHRSSRASLRGQRTASSGSIGSAEKPSSASKRSSRMRALKSTSVNEMQVKSQEAPSSKSLSESSRSQGSSGERLPSKTKSIRRHTSRRPTHATTQSLSSTDKGGSVPSKNDTEREKKPHRHRSKRYERHHKPSSDETKGEDQHTRPGATESRSRHMSSRPSKGHDTVVQGHTKPYVGNQESNPTELYENSEERDGTGSNVSMDLRQKPTSSITSLQESYISQTKAVPDAVGRETPLDTSPVANKMIKPASSMFKGLLGKTKSMHSDCVEKEDDTTPTKTAEKATQGDSTQHPTRKPPEKSRSQNGMSVLKNLLRKGSVVGEGDQNGEKKGQRWNGLKGGVDFTNRLKKAAGIERKASRPSKSEVRLEGDCVEQSNKAPTDDLEENVVSMEKEEEVNGFDHGYGMMMSLASFAPEDVEGLEEFHASLVGQENGNCDQDELASSKPAAETASSELRAPDLFSIMEKGIPKDPSAGNIDCDVLLATDRRKVFSSLTAPSMRFVSDKSTETITDKAPPPAVLEECEVEDEDEVDEGKDSIGIAESVVAGFGIQSESGRNDSPGLESHTETETKLDVQLGIAHDQGLDVVETEIDESEATQMDDNIEPEPLLSPLKFMQLTFKPTLSPAGELPIAIHNVDKTGPVSEADGDLHVMDKVDGADVPNESLLSPKTAAQIDCDGEDKTEVTEQFKTAVAPLDTFAPSATEVEFDELRRQLAASAARRKQSREAVRRLQEEILRHQDIYENACKERDAAMKALQENRIKISL